MSQEKKTIIGTDVFGLRCKACRLSSEYMEFTKPEVESGDPFKCKECEAELVDDSKALPVLQNMRCPICAISFARSRSKDCSYCGGELESADAAKAKAAAPQAPEEVTVDADVTASSSDESESSS